MVWGNRDTSMSYTIHKYFIAPSTLFHMYQWYGYRYGLPYLCEDKGSKQIDSRSDAKGYAACVKTPNI